MAQDFNSMFGTVNPQDAEAAYLARQQVSPNTMAQLPLLNQVVAMGGNAGAGLGNTVGRMLGGQTSVEADQALMKNIFSKAAAQSQDPMERLKLAAAEFDNIDPAKAQALRGEAAKFEEQRNKSAKAKTDAASATYKASQEAKLRTELQALPPNATEEQYLEVVRKYGSPDNVMRSMETRLQKQQALEAKQAEVAQRIAADLQRARENNASREDLARIAAEGRREIAQLIAANKTPSEQPPVAVVGPDGLPKFVSRVEAIRDGMTPAAELPKLAKDFQWNKERTQQTLIPGSPTDMKMRSGVAKEISTAKTLNGVIQLELDNIDKIIGNESGTTQQHPGLASVLGPVDSRFPTFFTSTANAEALVDGLASKTSISSLQTIRKTAGAVGSITEREWPKFESYKAILQKTQGTKAYTDNLKDYRVFLNGVMKEAKMEVQKAQEGLAAVSPSSGPSGLSPAAFDARWKNMRPGESLVGPDGKTYTKGE